MCARIWADCGITAVERCQCACKFLARTRGFYLTLLRISRGGGGNGNSNLAIAESFSILGKMLNDSAIPYTV